MATMFAPRQSLYQKKTTAIETLEICSTCQCRNPTSCAGPQTSPSHGGQYRAKNGNLRKLGWNYHHGTVFAPRQHLY